MSTAETATAASDEDVKTPQFEVLKEYPLRGGGVQQFRLTKVTTFTCNRCGREKTSRLVVSKDGNREKLMCNGCYGFLLKDGSPRP
jgi:formylmethanofuran dehydrogenase subunit E